MARPKKVPEVGKLNLPWQITAKHTSGMVFKGYVSEAQFREIQRVIFGQDELPLVPGA